MLIKFAHRSYFPDCWTMRSWGGELINEQSLAQRMICRCPGQPQAYCLFSIPEKERSDFLYSARHCEAIAGSAVEKTALPTKCYSRDQIKNKWDGRGMCQVWELRTGLWWGRLDGKGPLGRPKRRWKNSIKMDLEEVWWVGVGWMIWLRTGTVAGACVCGSGPLGSIKRWKSLD